MYIDCIKINFRPLHHKSKLKKNQIIKATSDNLYKKKLLIEFLKFQGFQKWHLILEINYKFNCIELTTNAFEYLITKILVLEKKYESRSK